MSELQQAREAAAQAFEADGMPTLARSARIGAIDRHREVQSALIALQTRKTGTEERDGAQKMAETIHHLLSLEISGHEAVRRLHRLRRTAKSGPTT